MEDYLRGRVGRKGRVIGVNIVTVHCSMCGDVIMKPLFCTIKCIKIIFGVLENRNILFYHAFGVQKGRGCC
jgi:hypothetical protein